MKNEGLSLIEEMIEKQITDMAETVTNTPKKQVPDRPAKAAELANTLNIETIGFEPHLFLIDFHQQITEQLLPKLDDSTGDIEQSLDELSPDPSKILPGEEKYYHDPAIEMMWELQENIANSEIGDFISKYLEESTFPPEAILLCQESLPKSIKEYLDKNSFRVGLELTKSLQKQISEIKNIEDLKRYHQRVSQIGLRDFGSTYVHELLKKNYESFKISSYDLLGTKLGEGNLNLDEVENMLNKLASSSVVAIDEKPFVEDAKQELSVDGKFNFFASAFANSFWTMGEKIRMSVNLLEIEDAIIKYIKLIKQMTDKGYFPQTLSDGQEMLADNVCIAFGFGVRKDYESLEALATSVAEVLASFNHAYDVGFFNEENFNSMMYHISNLIFRKPMNDLSLTKASIYLYKLVLQNIGDRPQLLKILQSHLDKTIQDWQNFGKSFEQNPEKVESCLDELKNNIARGLGSGEDES